MKGARDIGCWRRAAGAIDCERRNDAEAEREGESDGCNAGTKANGHFLSFDVAGCRRPVRDSSSLVCVSDRPHRDDPEKEMSMRE